MNSVQQAQEDAAALSQRLEAFYGERTDFAPLRDKVIELGQMLEGTAADVKRLEEELAKQQATLHILRQEVPLVTDELGALPPNEAPYWTRTAGQFTDKANGWNPHPHRPGRNDRPHHYGGRW